MTTEEVEQLRNEAELKIYDILAELESKTNCEVDSIVINRDEVRIIDDVSIKLLV